MKKNYSVKFIPVFAIVLAILSFAGCDPGIEKNGNKNTEKDKAIDEIRNSKKVYAGFFSNGMKGDSIFFVISEDGKRLEDLTFKGYWRCSGKLEYTTVGPEGFFEITDGKVDGAIVEPPDGGATAWRFELQADIQKNTATGSFRMNINNLGCDTYKLNFTAKAR